MGDIPLGVNFYSADVFANPELFDLTWSCGAPPDAMSVGAPQEVGPTDAFRTQWGQNWGFPLYDWARMREDGLHWWRRRVGRVRAFFDLFRIDHILGFYRVYAFPWRPEQNEQFIGINEGEARRRTGGLLPRFCPRGDDSRFEREANRADGESLLRILIDEAGAGAVIGEDLGCVPDYVRPSLRSLGVAGYKVPMWEQENGGALVPGARYERLSVAMYVTHDHAPLRAQWREWARSLRRAAHQVGTEQTDSSAEIATKSMRQLWDFAGLPASRMPPLNFTNSLHRALIAALLQSNSWLAIFMITDLFARTERFNVPGAVGEANWTQRTHVTIKELDAQPQTRWLRKLLRETGRASQAAQRR
jgi:4-alpha-glucanotransferase